MSAAVDKEEMKQENPQPEMSQQPNPSPPLEEDEAENIFQRSDDEVDDGRINNATVQREGEGTNAHHLIPKSPDEFWKRSVSMRGGRRGTVTRFSNQRTNQMPSWGSIEEHSLEDCGDREGGINIITPAVKGQRPEPKIHPDMFRYPPSSPIKASPPSSSPVYEHEEHESPKGEEWLPPQPNRTRPSNCSTVKTARATYDDIIRFPAVREPIIKPQFVRESKTAPRHSNRPSLAVVASTSHDSAESPRKSLRGGRVQVVGASDSITSWSLVSQSRSIESGEDSWGESGVSSDKKHPPSSYPNHDPIASTSPYVSGPFPPRYGMPYGREGGWYGPYPPSRYDYGCYPYPPPPPPGAPFPQPLFHGPEKQVDEEPHPLLRGYNPHKDSIVRPQFQNKKKKSQRIIAPDNMDRSGVLRKRRRRNPQEKMASAAAMAAAATMAAARAKEKKEKIDQGQENVNGIDSEEDIKTVGSVEDEEMPAAKRAAMASAVALRAAATGSPCPLPKAAAEVDFDIADPPLTPVHPPSITPVLDSASQMSDNDVLCGRGGGTNSQMGNRRYRALVRDFQPTYLMAKRREKPLMARSVVLVVRLRGGRFLRRDDTDGKLYEVGDEKAEAKTSQALREGLDVRATKTAANTLMGTESGKKRKESPSKTKHMKTSKPVLQYERPTIGKAAYRESATPIHVPMKHLSHDSSEYQSREAPVPPSHPHDSYHRPYPYHYPNPAFGHYAFPPNYGVFATPPRSVDHLPSSDSQTKEPNPFSPPRTQNPNKKTPLTPMRSH